MNYTENYKGIRLDVQMPEGSVQDGVQQQIRDTIDKLIKYANTINFCDIYLRITPDPGQQQKTVGIRLGIPGPDVFAEDKGEYWEPTIRSVAEKLIRQLDKKP